MRKIILCALCIGLVGLLAGCGMGTMPARDDDAQALQSTAMVASQDDAQPPDATTQPQPLLGRVQIEAGGKTLYADLYDNPTAAAFAELLPLTLDAFDRIGLVKSTLLPVYISDAGVRTREYALGAMFYWPEGPEMAFCYSDHLPETVVDIIHIGMVESGIEVFESYTGEIHITLVEELEDDEVDL